MTLTVKDIASYKTKIISNDQLNTESHRTLRVEVELDTLGMATIRFGNSFTLRINEFNVDELRSILFDASRQLALQRVNPSFFDLDDVADNLDDLLDVQPPAPTERL
jgi:hypothetical protein